MKVYRFEVDGRAFGAQYRKTWLDAARDAVHDGYASWSLMQPGAILWDASGGGEIREYEVAYGVSSTVMFPQEWYDKDGRRI